MDFSPLFSSPALVYCSLFFNVLSLLVSCTQPAHCWDRQLPISTFFSIGFTLMLYASSQMAQRPASHKHADSGSLRWGLTLPISNKHPGTLLHGPHFSVARCRCIMGSMRVEITTAISAALGTDRLLVSSTWQTTSKYRVNGWRNE